MTIFIPKNDPNKENNDNNPKSTIDNLHIVLNGLVVGKMALHHPSNDFWGLAEPQSMTVAKCQKCDEQGDTYLNEKKESR